MEYILLLFSIYAFVVGICVASFINVVIYRVPQAISIAKGRSFCPTCHHALSWLDLFPIVSYVCLRGKCRYCGDKIPVRDTLVELVGGVFSVCCFLLFPFEWYALLVFCIFMILLAITMIDIDTMTIPNGLILTLVVPALLMLFVQSDVTLLERCIGFACVSVPMYLLTRLIEDCFGGGDIKLIAVGGFMLGWKLAVLATFIAILCAGGYAIVLLIRKRTKKGCYIAFGPYLSFGIMISLLYGNELIYWYLSLFNLV